MGLRIKFFSCSWLILSLAVSTLVSVRDVTAQVVDVPTFPGEDPKVGKQTDPSKPLPMPGDIPPADPLPAPDLPADRRPKSTPKATSRPSPAGELIKSPTLDTEIVPAADGEKDPLGPAKTKSGGLSAPTTGDAPADTLVIKPEQIPEGRQTVGLAVEVVAPEVMNVNHAGTIKIIVKNTGIVDARAVRIHYDLPSELEFVSAQPEQKQLQPGDRGLFWGPETVAAGSEWLILLKVKATKVNTVDHAALVTLAVGSRTRTVIQEPMLKVEQTVTPSKLLKGQQARFTIVVTNPGSGPARNVVVRATLSSGLKADGEEIVEQTIPIIQAGGRSELDPLVVDTIAGGEQTCTVIATSPDVTGGPDAKVVRSVVVLRPELNLAITGPETRYTDTYADYKITATNPGTAAAKDVRVTVTLPPNSGKLQKPLPAGAEWNPTKQMLTWTIPKIDPRVGDVPGKAMATFTVLLGGPGMYRVVAEARAGDLHDKAAIATDVSGMADIDLNITEKRRVIDVGESTVFYIKMKNVGTKTAKNLLITAKLSPNLEVTDTAGTESSAKFENGELIFPVIESLPQGRTIDLSVKVKAGKAGGAACRVLLRHDDLPDPAATLEGVAHLRVTGVSEPRVSGGTGPRLK